MQRVTKCHLTSNNYYKKYFQVILDEISENMNSARICLNLNTIPNHIRLVKRHWLSLIVLLALRSRLLVFSYIKNNFFLNKSGSLE